MLQNGIGMYLRNVPTPLRCTNSRSSPIISPDPLQQKYHAYRRHSSPRIQISYTTDKSAINIDELEHLLSRCSVFAPGNALDKFEQGHSDSSQQQQHPHSMAHHTTSSNNNNTDTYSTTTTTNLGIKTAAAIDEKVHQTRKFKSRLETALTNSLVCVAAYVPEDDLLLYQKQTTSLPYDDRYKVAMLMPIDDNVTPLKVVSEWLDWIVTNKKQPKKRKVLVGFARAIGDASLVATIHDVIVAPEMRRIGLGSVLLDKITKQLYDLDIIDVGAMVPEMTERFFEKCSFGDDSEESVVMVLNRVPLRDNRLLPRLVDKVNE